MDAYLRECLNLGFDVVELSCGFITLPIEDWERLVRKVRDAGLKAKAEVGIQFGAGGASNPEALEAAGDGRSIMDDSAGDPAALGRRRSDHDCIRTWRTDMPARVAGALGLERVMFGGQTLLIPATLGHTFFSLFGRRQFNLDLKAFGLLVVSDAAAPLIGNW